MVVPLVSCLQNLHFSMIILLPNMRIFPVFLAISATNKPVNRSIHGYALTQLNVFALRGFIFRDIHKKTRKKFEQSGLWNTKKNVAGKYTRARAPLVCKYTNRIFESKDGTKSMKIVNYIERHNFCWNGLLTKPNRTEIQAYKVEERTLGTPCICFYFSIQKLNDPKGTTG